MDQYQQRCLNYFRNGLICQSSLASKIKISANIFILYSSIYIKLCYFSLAHLALIATNTIEMEFYQSFYKNSTTNQEYLTLNVFQDDLYNYIILNLSIFDFAIIWQQIHECSRAFQIFVNYFYKWIFFIKRIFRF